MKTRQTNGTAETSKTYTKKDLVIKIAEETGLPQLAAGELVQQVLDGICAALADGYRVEFRIGRNPKNPAGEVKIPSCETIRFKPGRIMRCICGKEK